MKQKIQQKIDLKTKPPGSLGKLEDLAHKIASIQDTLTPELNKPSMLVFAADHGIADEGVSPFPKEVTYQMVMNFLHGGAAINVFCKQNGIDLKVVDAGVDFDFPKELDLIHSKICRGTNNIINGPAMSLETCNRAIEEGNRITELEYEKGCNIIGFGEMGIANTSSASLLMSKYTGIPIEDCTGRGTGHDDQGLSRKLEILKKASEKYDLSDPLEILACYGGLEIAMICGAMMKACERNMIIMVDGFISTAAMLAANALNSRVKENAIFCHSSSEKGHKAMLEYLEVEAIVDLGMRLGEGSGAAVVFPIIQSAVNFMNEMASFEDAGVSNK